MLLFQFLFLPTNGMAHGTATGLACERRLRESSQGPPGQGPDSPHSHSTVLPNLQVEPAEVSAGSSFSTSTTKPHTSTVPSPRTIRPICSAPAPGTGLHPPSIMLEDHTLRDGLRACLAFELLALNCSESRIQTRYLRTLPYASHRIRTASAMGFASLST